ncbi:toxin glutamine deamidase domain-containing protein [Micromonospora sp. DT4]|uniref:toxin glutamine deamidase domain-containing protein n=1 Tax=Micromonospora sp. DT4 TaxID=3393438 RepID=UPI003CEC61E6
MADGSGHQASDSAFLDVADLTRFANQPFEEMANYDAVTARMMAAPPGARGIVVVNADAGGDAHVFNVARRTEGVYYLDGQLGGQARAPKNPDQIRFLRTNITPLPAGQTPAPLTAERETPPLALPDTGQDAPLSNPVVLPPDARTDEDLPGHLYWVGHPPLRPRQIRDAAAGLDNPVIVLGVAKHGAIAPDEALTDLRRLVQQFTLKKQQPVVVTRAAVNPPSDHDVENIRLQHRASSSRGHRISKRQPVTGQRVADTTQ